MKLSEFIYFYKSISSPETRKARTGIVFKNCFANVITSQGRGKMMYSGILRLSSAPRSFTVVNLTPYIDKQYLRVMEGYKSEVKCILTEKGLEAVREYLRKRIKEVEEVIVEALIDEELNSFVVNELNKDPEKVAFLASTEYTLFAKMGAQFIFKKEG